MPVKMRRALPGATSTRRVVPLVSSVDADADSPSAPRFIQVGCANMLLRRKHTRPRGRQMRQDVGLKLLQ